MSDVVEETMCRLKDVPYKGNFNINYHSKEQLELLQRFFGVRRTKFDMALLEKRPALQYNLEEEYNDKRPNS